MMSFWRLALTAALPVLNVFMMTAVGAALAHKGILDSHARHTLSKLVFLVFLPALTFYNLSRSISLSDLAVWWILPVNVCISISIGLVVGRLASRLLEVETRFRNHFMCVIALGNMGNLPLVLISTICAGATPFRSELGAQCGRLGIAYIACSMLADSKVRLQYSVAYQLMKPLQAPVAVELKAAEAQGQSSPALPLQGEGKRPLALQQGDATASIQMAITTGWQKGGQETEAGVRAEAAAGLAEEALGRQEEWPDAEQEERAPLRAAGAGAVPSQQGLEDLWQQCRRACVAAWQRLYAVKWGDCINAPTLAAFAGLAVGCTSPVKGLLFGQSPPLGFLAQPLETLGGGMVPSSMLILGASLSKGPGAAKLAPRVIASAVFIRLALIPALGTAVVVAMQRLGWFQPPDSLFTFTLLLMHATPTAMNLQTVATLVQSGQDEIACLLCWQYLACLISLPLWMSLFVWLAAP